MGKAKKQKFDSDGVEMTMKPYHYIGDALGQMGLNMTNSLVAFLTYFYTEKIGLAAGVVGTLMLVKNIIDAFTDIGMGAIMDRVHPKSGRAKPWLLWMSLPMFVGTIAQFAIPDSIPTAAKYAWALLSMVIASGFIFTALSIPYNSLITYLTKSVAEKRTIGILRAALGVLFSIFVGIIIMPVTNALGGDKAAWIKLVSALALFTSVCMVITYLVTKERNTDLNDDDEKSRYSTIESVKNLFGNRYWVITLVVGICMNIFYAVINGSGVAYYAQYVLGDSNLSGTIATFLLIPLIAGFVLTGPCFKKFGMVRTIQVFQVFGIVGCIVRMIFPTNFTVVAVTACMMTFASTAINGALGVLVNTSAVYNKVKYGDGMVAMSNGATSFGYKVGSGLGAAVTGWILAFAGYNSALAEQPAGVVSGAAFIYNVIPLVTMAIVAVILHWYDLEKKLPEMMASLEEK